ncbi:MAG: ThuA domain-containing protein [Pontiella sp.]
MKKWIWFNLLIGFSLGTVVYAEENNKMPVKVLIVDGFSNHDWQHTTACIKAVLNQSDRFDIAVNTFSENADGWSPSFKNYDVVIQTCNDIGGGPTWPRQAELALEEYVAAGGGLYVFHSANNAFPHWEEYNRMIGLGWRNKDFGWAITIDTEGHEVRIPAGEGENTDHGKRVDALLTRSGNHPIHEGFPRQWTAADIEIYRYARGPAENLTVLSYAQDAKTKLNFPIEWTVAYGDGRAYNSTFGHVWKDQHEPKGVRCAGFQTLMPRVVQWLAGREPDAGIPDDFPTDQSAHLKPYPRAK